MFMRLAEKLDDFLGARSSYVFSEERSTLRFGNLIVHLILPIVVTIALIGILPNFFSFGIYHIIYGIMYLILFIPYFLFRFCYKFVLTCGFVEFSIFRYIRLALRFFITVLIHIDMLNLFYPVFLSTIQKPDFIFPYPNVDAIDFYMFVFCAISFIASILGTVYAAIYSTRESYREWKGDFEIRKKNKEFERRQASQNK